MTYGAFLFYGKSFFVVTRRVKNDSRIRKQKLLQSAWISVEPGKSLLIYESLKFRKQAYLCRLTLGL